MGRIIYLIASYGGVAGGHKMALRHVETLRELGFNAVAYITDETPTWLEHKAPLEVRTPIWPDDLLVLPDDATKAMEQCIRKGYRAVVFAQSTYRFAAVGYDVLERFPADRFPEIMAIAPRQAQIIRRAFPQARIHMVPCFADERRFRPGEKLHQVACAPRKRRVEAGAIRQYLKRFHPGHAALPWRELDLASEGEVAAAFAVSDLHLSLSRLEAVGITALEAMASGCLCAGFTGVGGREYATDDNGFWVAEDDVLGAADALAAAADLALTGGPALARMVDAGRAAADAWSYARFRPKLEAAFMAIAPEMRLRNGPLDADASVRVG